MLRTLKFLRGHTPKSLDPGVRKSCERGLVGVNLIGGLIGKVLIKSVKT